MAKPKEDRSDQPKRMGRPAVADDARRSTLVRVLTTEAEYEELKQAADTASMSVSTWMRALALEKARQKAG